MSPLHPGEPRPGRQPPDQYRQYMGTCTFMGLNIRKRTRFGDLQHEERADGRAARRQGGGESKQADGGGARLKLALFPVLIVCKAF